MRARSAAALLRAWLGSIVAGGLLLAAAGCGSSDSSSAEVWPTRGWRVEAPEQHGMDGAVLDGARAYAFQDGKYTQGVVVVRHGVIVAEWYEGGRDATSFATSWSVAKSFTSALIGIAIAEGLIDGVDASVAEFLPDWRGTDKEAITLRHVLSMESGLLWDEDYTPDDVSDIIRMIVAEHDHLAYAAARPAEVPPGTRFSYSSGDTMLLSGVLEAVTGGRAGDYAREKLFAPLGMEPVDWWRDAAGHTVTYCCLDTPSRQLAKFGLLYLRGGRWEDRQVVPAAWVAASTSPGGTWDGYGYQWWLSGRDNPDLPDDFYAARGHDGQYILVVPSRDLVVVRSGHYDKYPGEPVADPSLWARLPSDGYLPGQGSVPPDSWSDSEFLAPILGSIR
jgi:CubicO group peptidase (beta-lactamase class C family)